ncbi:glycosyltransferase [Brevibacterium luteolum]|uniref:glycosyltransferase n=1 Tax=Brevibacterium luteolum TaxID=199591 RepID=UPI003B66DCB2
MTETEQSTAPADRTTLRICIPTETYAPEVNGAATFAQTLATGLAARGHEVHVICPSATGTPSTAREDGVLVHRIRSHRWYLHPTWTICMPWETKPEVSRLLDLIRPDVVHAQAHFVIGRYALSESRERGIPVVATNHFMPDNVRPYLNAPERLLRYGSAAAWWDLRRCFEKADYLTVPTQLSADLLTENGFRSSIQAVSCGIDLSHFFAADDVEQTHPTVLFVGRLSLEKNIGDLIAALARTDPSLNLHADIIGAGSEAEPLRTLAAELGVADRVRLRGKVSDEELVRAYQEATFFCMPSTAELQSIATLEAMASGKPVVLADAVALPHLCRHGENGYLFEPRSVDALTDAFTRLLTMSDTDRQQMGQASRELVSRHDVRHTLDTFEAIYRQVLAEAQPAVA